MWRFIIIFLLFISVQAAAHQPKLIYDIPSKNSPFLVKNPEISKAFYELLGCFLPVFGFYSILFFS